MHSRVGRACLARTHCSVARFESGQRPFRMPTLSSSSLSPLFPPSRGISQGNGRVAALNGSESLTRCLRAFLPLTVVRHCWRLLASFHSSASSTYHESHPRLNKASQISSLRISLSLKQIFLSKRYRVIELINWRRDSPSRILVGTWILEYNQIVSLPR